MRKTSVCERQKVDRLDRNHWSSVFSLFCQTVPIQRHGLKSVQLSCYPPANAEELNGSVIFNQQGQVLLLKHRFRAGSGWGLPGGFIKRSEQPLDALRRELEEEIALKIENPQVFWARSFARPRQVEILFICETQAVPNPQSMEVESAVWFSADDLPTGLPQDQKLLIERAVAKRKV